MGLNPRKGNMYPWITHTWNTIKGICPHGCVYCYMHRFPQKPVRFDEGELKTDLGERNFIFVGSSCDMFAALLPDAWINTTLDHCRKYDNQYLFQSKNSYGMASCREFIPTTSILCTTIETNRVYRDCKAPTPSLRSQGMELLLNFRRFITVEPIMDFDLWPFLDLIRRCEPEQVNIGADSGGHHLPEPPASKIMTLEEELKKFTRVERKKNLSRLLKG